MLSLWVKCARRRSKGQRSYPARWTLCRRDALSRRSRCVWEGRSSAGLRNKWWPVRLFWNPTWRSTRSSRSWRCKSCSAARMHRRCATHMKQSYNVALCEELSLRMIHGVRFSFHLLRAGMHNLFACPVRNKIIFINYGRQWVQDILFFVLLLFCSHTLEPNLMGVGRIFSREGPIVDFPGVAKNIFAAGTKSGKISFQPHETKKETFLMGKCRIWKSTGALAFPYRPFKRPCPACF